MQPSKDFSYRFDAAKRWRDQAERDIKTALKFCAPGRELDFSDRPQDSDPIPEIFTSFAEELAGDLASDFVNYFTPAEQRWCEFEVLSEIPEQMEKQVFQLVQDREDAVFGMIEGSNYYDAAPQIFLEAAIHGTPAFWVEQGHITEPLYVEPVPIHELYVTPGHRGYLDRFRRKWVRAEFLNAQLARQNPKFPPEIERKIKTPGAMCVVVWGFWLDWSEPAVPVWKMEITVDGKRVTEEGVVLGPMDGACPLMVGRFNPRVGRPHGRGSGIRCLPEVLTLDDIIERNLDNLDAALDPAFFYADDGILDLRDGIKRGGAYPSSRAGQRDPVQKLDLSGDLDYGWFSEEAYEEKMRRAFYQDGPRQRGDTPPSATQWLDEARRVQRRIGKPSAPMWHEMIYPFVQRVEFIAAQTGVVQGRITHQGRDIKVTPLSPLQKAQNEDKALVTRSNLAMAGELGAAGEILQQGFGIDLRRTFQNIAKSTGDELIAFSEGQNDTPPTQA